MCGGFHIRKDKRWRRKMMTVEEWANAKAKFEE